MDELMHHGIKGMKWYQRRYQNKDGSLTPQGRIRYGAVYKKSSKPASSTSSEKPKQKSVSEMSDQELQSAINRKRLEQEYARLNPKQISRGQKFAKTVLNDVVVPAAKSAGKAYVEQQLKKALGVQEKKKRQNNNNNSN